MRFITRLTAAFASLVLLAGCSQLEPDAKPTPVEFMGCVLSDNFGLDDQSVGSQSFMGALQAQAQFGIKLRHLLVDANSTFADYATALKIIMENECDVVVAVGSSAEVVETKANFYPKVDFILVHGRPYSLGESTGLSPAELPNVKNISYDSAQAAFLAGYLAATQSESRIVAAYGATLNRAEIAMLAGFSQGVDYANSLNQQATRLLGQATPGTDLWLSTGQANSSGAEAKLNQLVGEGADIVFPVVGGTQQNGPGISATAAAALSSRKVAVIGSFTNWYDSEAASDIHAVILASVVLTIQKDVSAAIGQALSGQFVGGEAGEYLGTLQNNSVYLSGPYEQQFNSNFVGKIDDLKSKIASGEIVVKSSLQ